MRMPAGNWAKSNSSASAQCTLSPGNCCARPAARSRSISITSSAPGVLQQMLGQHALARADLDDEVRRGGLDRLDDACRALPARAGNAGRTAYAGDASWMASFTASIRLPGSARPVPATSSAVPWSTEVRTNGRPSVTLTPSPNDRVLEHRQPLVVVHGEHRSRRPSSGAGTNSVSAGSGPAGVDAGGLRFGDRRRDHVGVLVAEVAALAAVRIQAGDQDARAARCGSASAGRRGGRAGS